MRRLAVAVLATLAFAPAAHAADCTLQISPQTGPAPLTVSYVATCDVPASAHWSFGDGGGADGLTAQHTYRAGRWGQSLEVQASDGSILHYDLVQATAYRIVLATPRRADYGDLIRLQGKLYPPLPGTVTIAGGPARRIAPGVFRVFVRASRPGPFVARFRGASSTPVWVLLRPRLSVRVVGSPTVGSDLRVAARLEPASAGVVRVKVDGRRATRISTGHAHTARVVVSTIPRKGWTGPGKILRVAVVEPRLGFGSRSPGVRALEHRLRELHYALRGEDGIYGQDDVEAVYAFQKVNGLARTGAVDSALWARLLHAGVPHARYRGDHIEVDKARQVLFVVRGGKVAFVVHVSTGATGNTPVGVWPVYSKVPGWSWVLWYPSFFLRGFAIHGYPDVPPYPASHGCVRVPMWIAPQLYADAPFGSTIMVYT